MMAGQHGLKKVNKNHLTTHGFGNTRRQDVRGDRLAINANLKIESRLQKEKEKQNTKLSPPPCVSLGQKREEREKEKSRARKLETSKTIPPFFPLKYLSANTHITHLKTEIMSK